MSELYLVVDAFDGEANIFASKDEVEAFLQSNYQEGPALYQIITDAESLDSEEFKPYLRELEIPAGWKYVDPEDEEQGETA